MPEPTLATTAPDGAPSATRTVLRQSVVITAAGLVGKVLAVVRDAVVGRAFGAGAATDTLFLALSLPVTLSTIVAGGGLRVAFQPALARRLAAGDERGAWRSATLVLGAVAAVAVPAAVVVALFPTPFARLLGGEAMPADLPHMLRLLAAMLPLLVLLDVFTGLLHARLRFLWPALEAPIRSATIAAAVLLFASAGVDAVAWGHLSGTAIVVGACAAAAFAGGFRLVRPDRGDRAELLGLARASVPAMLGSSVYPVGALVDRAMAAWLPDGSVAALSFADGLWQAGLVASGPIATVAFPVLATLVADRDEAGFAATVLRTTRASLVLTAPLGALLAALALPAVTVLFQRGRFDAGAAELTAGVAAAFALGLPFVAAQAVLVRALQARGDLAGPARLALVALGVHAALNLPLMAIAGPAGIALSGSIVAALSVALLARRLGTPAPGRLRFGLALATAFAACALAAGGAARLVPPLGSPLVDGVAALTAGSLAGLAAFAAAASAWRLEEVAGAARIVREKLGRRG